MDGLPPPDSNSSNKKKESNSTAEIETMTKNKNGLIKTTVVKISGVYLFRRSPTCCETHTHVPFISISKKSCCVFFFSAKERKSDRECDSSVVWIIALVLGILLLVSMVTTLGLLYKLCTERRRTRKLADRP